MTFDFQSWHLAEQQIIMERLFFVPTLPVAAGPHQGLARSSVSRGVRGISLGKLGRCERNSSSTQGSSLLNTGTCSLIDFQVIFIDFPSLKQGFYMNKYTVSHKLEQMRTPLLLPAVSMLWVLSGKDLHSLSLLVRLSDPHSSPNDSACQLWSLSGKTVFASGHHYPSEPSSTADAHYGRKS